MDAVELRVHGVSGTPPDELLDRPAVRQVSGDRIAGCYRPAAGSDRDLPTGMAENDPTVDRYPLLEGYSWGGLTSGARSRALWLALAPFALVNVAPRMLPPDPPGGRGRRLRWAAAALLRVLAGSLTMTIVLGATAGVTALAVRCAAPPDGVTDCYGLPGWLTGLLGRLAPSGRLALAAVIPVVLLLLLFWISRATTHRYSSPAAVAQAQSGRPDDEPMPLRRGDLWLSGVAGRRMRLLHIQIGLSAVAVILAWYFPSSGMRTAVLLAGALTLGCLLAATAFRLRPGYGLPAVDRVPLTVRWYWAAVVVTWAGTAVLLADGGAAGSLHPDHLVLSADVLVRGLFAGQAALLGVVAILVTVARAAGAGRGRSMYLAGYAGVVMAFLGWLLGSALTAAVLIVLPSWVGIPGFAFTPGQVGQLLRDHQEWFGDTTRSTGIGALIALAVVGVLIAQLAVRYLLAQRLGGTRADRAQVLVDYPDQAGAIDPQSVRRRRSIGTMYWVARRVDRVPVGLGVFTAIMTLEVLLQGVATVLPDRPAWLSWVLGASTEAAGAVAWGVFVAGGLLLGVVLVAVLAYRTPLMRRGVGVVWDLSCFWPRDTHPFAPPCYNERVMPEVRARIGRLLEPSDARLVLAGHSQGSVISAVAVLGLPPAQRDRLGLLTFGCVLDRLYARFFPRYFSEEIFQDLAADLTSAGQQTRWVNLWRRTDFLGGSVPYPPGPDRGPRQIRCVDPVFDPRPGEIVYPAAGRHSGFWRDPVFQQQVADLVSARRPEVDDLT